MSNKIRIDGLDGSGLGRFFETVRSAGYRVTGQGASSSSHGRMVAGDGGTVHYEVVDTTVWLISKDENLTATGEIDSIISYANLVGGRAAY